MKQKTAEEIISEVWERAKCGSCKTCLFCFPEIQKWGLMQEFPGGRITTTHICEFQGNMNPVHLTDADLEQQFCSYEVKLGNTWVDDEAGRLSECLAYLPKFKDSDKDWAKIHELACQHREFMETLAQATHLESDINTNKLSELRDKLNKAHKPESVPCP